MGLTDEGRRLLLQRIEAASAREPYRYTAEDVRLANESDLRVPLPGAVPKTGIRAMPANLSGGTAVTTTETEQQKVYRAAFAIGNAYRMSNWYSSWRRPSGRLEGLMDAIVTVKNTTEDSRGSSNYDGEYDQGSEGEITIEFKVAFDDGSELYLQKTGYQDSYGDNANWEGPWKVGRSKTIVAYE
jgi:hypothetical protein